MNDAGTMVRTLEEVRSTYGWEKHGDIGTYNKDKNDLTPESMGGSTVTFRVPWGPKSYQARPMLSTRPSTANGPRRRKWPTISPCPRSSGGFRMATITSEPSTTATPSTGPGITTIAPGSPGGDLLTGDKGARLGCQEQSLRYQGQLKA